MANLFDFGSTPTPTQAQLEPGTQGLLNQGAGLASRPSGSFANDSMANVKAATGALGSPTHEADQASTGMTPGMKQAMLGSYGQQAGSSFDRMMQNSQMNAKMQKAQMLRQYAQAALGQQSALVNHYNNLTDAYNASEAARAQVISQVSGLANYGIGSYMGAKSMSGSATPDMNLNATDIEQANQGSMSGYYPGNVNTPF